MNLNLILKDREELKSYEFIKGVGIDYCNSKETDGNHLPGLVVISNGYKHSRVHHCMHHLIINQ